MEHYTSGARRWRTATLDTMGIFAIIWSIPLVIVVIGAPVALALYAIRQMINWVVAQ